MMADPFAPEAARLLLQAINSNQRPFIGVRSDSMAPILRRGDQIQLGPVAGEGPDLGDIIVLGSLDDLLAHRYWGQIVLAGETYLLTRGDRLPYYDTPVPESQLRALVVGRRRSGRFLPLDHGKGAWLNRNLAQLARLEAQLLQLSIPDTTTNSGSVANIGNGRRFIRRLLLTMADGSTALFGR